MQKELKNISEAVMDRIYKGEIKMRPKIYFILGSVLTFLGLVASIAVSVFAVGAIRFVLRSNGGIVGHKLERIFTLLPWWLLPLAVVGLVSGIILVRKYDFSYKIGYKRAVVVAILVVISAGWLADALGFNSLLERRGLMRGMMRRNYQEESMKLNTGPRWNTRGIRQAVNQQLLK
jgi:hypothetical protein